MKALKKKDRDLLPTAVMVRQPIYDGNLKVVAYKLLYKNEEDINNSLLSDSEFAIHVMLEEYTSIYESGEIKCLPAFIRLPLKTAGALKGYSEGSDIFVEVDARLSGDPDFKACLGHLSEQDFRITLANYPGNDDMLDLMECVDVVRMDVHRLRVDQLKYHLCLLQSYGNLTVLAENIDSVEVLEECIELGFDLFQGQFLSKPRVMSEAKLNVNQTAILQLIAELQKADATPESIEEVVQMDPVLTYKLLRIVNSAAFSLIREVTSIADTIVMLGLNQVQQLAMVIATSSQSDKPMEMYRSMLMRGHMCEVIAKKVDPENKSTYFLVGVMSGLHLVFDTSKKNLLKHLPVTDGIKLAILEGAGPLGEVLHNASNYAEGSWDELPASIDIDLYEYAYMESIRWVEKIFGSAI